MIRTSSNRGAERPVRLQTQTHALRVHRWLTAVAIALMLALAFGGPAALPLAQVAAQTANPTPDPANQTGEETPVAPRDPTAPQSSQNQNQQAQETPAPETDNQSSTQQTQQPSSGADAATGAGEPAVLAHGLAYVSGDQVVWQVRETEMPDAADAEATTSNAAIMLQRDGSTVVRNDATGKRAKLDPGEAYFRAADDPYTAISDSNGSVVWTFELVLSNDVADDAFYESPLIDDLSEGVYDMMLTRFVLQPGDSAPLPDHTGPALLMISTGEVDVEDDSGLSTLAASDGQLMPGDGTVTNNSTSPAVYVVALLGDEVSDDTAAAPQQQATTPEATTETSTDTTTTEETPAAEATTEAAPAEPATDESGQYQTSINVTANAEIYLVITADGVTVFDGTLPAGSSSGAVVGSTFEVYTSSGVNTVFTNACGDTFQMGYEEGEANYVLTADASSCAP